MGYKLLSIQSIIKKAKLMELCEAFYWRENTLCLKPLSTENILL